MDYGPPIMDYGLLIIDYIRTRYNGLWMIANNKFEILKIRNFDALFDPPPSG